MQVQKFDNFTGKCESSISRTCITRQESRCPLLEQLRTLCTVALELVTFRLLHLSILCSGDPAKCHLRLCHTCRSCYETGVMQWIIRSLVRTGTDVLPLDEMGHTVHPSEWDAICPERAGPYFVHTNCNMPSLNQGLTETY